MSDFEHHLTVFRSLRGVEDLSDGDYEVLTRSEDTILRHNPASRDEALALAEVIRVRYGEPEDEGLHEAIQSIIDLTERRRAA